ncbi:MAG: hypothetical protein GY864_10655 [Desulfobacterales bacterium]|nr:hypothetical protein [Desulfobacterales bacterium]
MKKMSQSLWVAILLSLSFIMLAACATTPKGEATALSKVEVTPGLYVHTSPAFSVKYPTHWKYQKIKGDEVLHVANTNMWKIPNLRAFITDLTEGAELSSKAYMDSVKNASPGSKRFKVLSEKMITLNDGSQALAFTFKWTYTDGVTKLQSAALNTFKDGKNFACLATTTFGGDTTPDKLLEIVTSFKFM